jgi:hypothetical protein
MTSSYTGVFTMGETRVGDEARNAPPEDRAPSSPGGRYVSDGIQGDVEESTSDELEQIVDALDDPTEAEKGDEAKLLPPR